jgi:RecJ-like exonuclease
MHKPKYEVCPVCEGKGTVLGSAFRGVALDQELVDDDEFMEGYLGGHYDVRCDECNGLRVIDANIVKDPCDSCGKQMYSWGWREFHDGPTWTEYECRNQDCEEYSGR